MLVTYDEFGGYGHPDHIQAHRVATYAAALAAVPSYRRDLGEPWDIAKIYWGAMSESRMREGLRGAARRRATRRRSRAWTPTAAAAVRRPPTTTSPPPSTRPDYVEQKMDAMRAHATQIAVDGPFFALSNNVGNAVWGIEYFRLAKGTPGPVDGRPRRKERS